MPTRVKSAGGKKCAVANSESDDDEVFIPRYDILSVVIFKLLFD